MDRVLPLCDLAWAAGKPGTGPMLAKRTRSEAAVDLDHVIGGTGARWMTLNILRAAGRPLSTHECAEAFAALLGVNCKVRCPARGG